MQMRKKLLTAAKGISGQKMAGERPDSRTNAAFSVANALLLRVPVR